MGARFFVGATCAAGAKTGQEPRIDADDLTKELPVVQDAVGQDEDVVT
ncbi:hypothetical protein [Streptomyces anulatus]